MCACACIDNFEIVSQKKNIFSKKKKKRNILYILVNFLFY